MSTAFDCNRCIVWKELGAVGLLGLLDPTPSPRRPLSASSPPDTAACGHDSASNDQPMEANDRNLDATGDRNRDTADSKAISAAVLDKEDRSQRLPEPEDVSYASATTAAIATAETPAARVGEDESTRMNSTNASSKEGDVDVDADGQLRAESYLYPSDVDKGIIDAYLDALEHPRFGPPRGGRSERLDGGRREAVGTEQQPQDGEKQGWSFMRSVAVHHVACYLFSPPTPLPARPSSSSLSVKSSCAPSDDPLQQQGQQQRQRQHHVVADDAKTLAAKRDDNQDARAVVVDHVAGAAGSDGTGAALGLDEQLEGTVGEAAIGSVDHRESPPGAVPPGSSCWRPDFGRRKRFERVLLMGSPSSMEQGKQSGGGWGGDCATGVAEMVLGYEWGDSTAGQVGEGKTKKSDGPQDGAMVENVHNNIGGGCVEKNGGCPDNDGGACPRSSSGVVSMQSGLPSLPRTKCLWSSLLGPDRRNALQAYCRVYATTGGGVDGRDGLSDVDIAAWLGGEGERRVEDVVHRLRARLRRSPP